MEGGVVEDKEKNERRVGVSGWVGGYDEVVDHKRIKEEWTQWEVVDNLMDEVKVKVE